MRNRFPLDTLAASIFGAGLAAFGPAVAQPDEEGGRAIARQQTEASEAASRGDEFSEPLEVFRGGGDELRPENVDPYALGDDTWLSLSGTVTTVSRDSFVLDYGDGEIIVELDDGDRDADAYQLLAGDTVVVNGEIDDDLFERTTIEASSVYVEKLGTYFYASAIDEESRNIFTPPGAVMPSAATLVGTVTEVDDDEFRLATGNRMLTIEVEDMENNPLDDEGYQRIEVGDVVSVAGQVDRDFLEGREIEASSVTTLWKHPG